MIMRNEDDWVYYYIIFCAGGYVDIIFDAKPTLESKS